MNKLTLGAGMLLASAVPALAGSGGGAAPTFNGGGVEMIWTLNTVIISLLHHLATLF
jgi:hypothetical protein